MTVPGGAEYGFGIEAGATDMNGFYKRRTFYKKLKQCIQKITQRLPRNLLSGLFTSEAT